MKNSETIEQRIIDFKVFCTRNKLTMKEVCEKADINYASVKNNMQIANISDERMSLLEDTAVDIAEEKEAEKVTA